jgi:AraC-like DNA-binding protein
MIFAIEERLSDSPFVERIWRARSEPAGGAFLSIAMSHWEMVVTKGFGQTMLTLRGPETRATRLYCPPDGEWIGIRFRIGTVMPHLPASNLVDEAVNLPDASTQSFWLQDSAWQFPNFENADVFVDLLQRKGMLVRDPVVDSALQDQLHGRWARTAQRHFLRTTGLTQSAVRQIERARHATNLLQNGATIGDTVSEAGYFDQSHLTKSLKHFIGQTPTQIIAKSEQLSFLYKTAPLPSGTFHQKVRTGGSREKGNRRS